MPTVYTDALYSSTNLGVVTNDFFGLSATNNTITLKTAGTLAGQNVVGIAYNNADWAAASAAAARRVLTINPFNSGSASGTATTLTTGVSSSGGLSFALLLANRQAVVLSYVGSTITYAADLSAATFDVSDKNTRRLQVLGITA
jgi:hypothetical protein